MPTTTTRSRLQTSRMIATVSCASITATLCAALYGPDGSTQEALQLEPAPRGAAERRADQLTAESFDRWREYLLPADEELRWERIGWRSQFWQRVIEAQIEGKPILLWAMNGHPMGCV